MENISITKLKNNVEMYQYTDGFRFSVDPIILVDFFQGKKKGKVLDLGSGTGIISILLAKEKEMENIHALEIQNSSVQLLRKNIELNQLEEKIKVIHCDVKEYKEANSYDYIITNPPYMVVDGKKISENENKKIARHEIKLDLESLIKNSKRLLKPRGELFLVHRSHRTIEIISELEKNKFSIARIQFVYFDKTKTSNLVLIQASKGKKNEVKILQPLYLEENGY